MGFNPFDVGMKELVWDDPPAMSAGPQMRIAQPDHSILWINRIGF